MIQRQLSCCHRPRHLSTLEAAIMATGKKLQGENEQLREAIDELETRLRARDSDLALADEQRDLLAAIVESSDDAVVGCTLSDGHPGHDGLAR
jgi:hypothetical protein